MNIIQTAMRSLAPLLLVAAYTTSADTLSAERQPPPPLGCTAFSPAGTPLVRGINCRWVAVDGYPRRYIVYVPFSAAYSPRRAAPLVFYFHGAGGGAAHVLETSG